MGWLHSLHHFSQLSEDLSLWNEYTWAQAMELMCAPAGSYTQDRRASLNWIKDKFDRPFANWMMSGGCFPLEYFLGIFCLCDTMNAKIQARGQEMSCQDLVSVGYRHVLTLSLILAVPFWLTCPDYKWKRRSNVANHSSILLATLVRFSGCNRPPSPNPTTL